LPKIFPVADRGIDIPTFDIELEKAASDERMSDSLLATIALFPPLDMLAVSPVTASVAVPAAFRFTTF
jgi:hypothetical protein